MISTRHNYVYKQDSRSFESSVPPLPSRPSERSNTGKSRSNPHPTLGTTQRKAGFLMQEYLRKSIIQLS